LLRPALHDRERWLDRPAALVQPSLGGMSVQQVKGRQVLADIVMIDSA